MKVNPVIQAEQTLVVEQAEQLVLMQEIHCPLVAEKPVVQFTQKLVELQVIQLVLLHVTQALLKTVLPGLQTAQN
jgi:hypothetical protein